MENKETSFEYTYSAAQREEAEKIRRKYVQPQQTKMDLLRQLDRSASRKAQRKAITVGTIGTLLLGVGMSLSMTDLGQILGLVWNGYDISMPLGIVIGLVGIVQVALAYPVYDRALKKARKRIAPEILRLTDELMR